MRSASRAQRPRGLWFRRSSAPQRRFPCNRGLSPWRHHLGCGPCRDIRWKAPDHESSRGPPGECQTARGNCPAIRSISGEDTDSGFRPKAAQEIREVVIIVSMNHHPQASLAKSGDVALRSSAEFALARLLPVAADLRESRLPPVSAATNGDLGGCRAGRTCRERTPD